jgi:hypothetical protein
MALSAYKRAAADKPRQALQAKLKQAEALSSQIATAATSSPATDPKPAPAPSKSSQRSKEKK